MTYNDEQKNTLYIKLREQFPADQVHWVCFQTSKDKKKARYAAYADIRAYLDRLNDLFTPGGWTKTVKAHTVSCIHNNMQAAKVIFTVLVSIPGIGEHESTAEGLVDTANLSTRCEAQALKRACSEFGLGRYLYDIPKSNWVPVDQNGQPENQLPHPHDWAARAGQAQAQTQTNLSTGNVITMPGNNSLVSSEVQKTEAIQVPQALIKRFEPNLGKALCQDVFATTAAQLAGKTNDPSEKGRVMAEKMTKAEQMINALMASAEGREESFSAYMDKMSVKDIRSIPSVDVLRRMFKTRGLSLESLAA